ncbi:hypothetical protein [Aureliella helgolandensis]|uniref:hypothetical protein n=1 Tax=Aureliella helgolandensis TaxID=2527968 RepID=UPI0018D17D6B|nr:hypothetical protein [Aureliella helgolandensis]
MRGQQEIGFVERFALATDRASVLQELIPGTQEYYYYHCLHLQNEEQLPQAQKLLDEWRTKLGENSQTQSMQTRQHLLAYEGSPEKTLEYLRNRLGIQLSHASPARDRAADLPNRLDPARLSVASLLQERLKSDSSLNSLEDSGLELALAQELSYPALRALIGRLHRADLPGTVERIAEELAHKQSQSFGWAPIHSQLSLAQLEQLIALRPSLLEEEAFVQQYSALLVPAAGSSLDDKVELRNYLDRLLVWSQRLPASQNDFKALVLGNLLKLDMSEGIYDRQRFLTYLALPRAASYYSLARFGKRLPPLVELNYSMQPQVSLKPVGDDSSLVRRYLEQFLLVDDSVDAFAEFLDRAYLDQVFAETKILHGVGDVATGDSATWYGKLIPEQQRELRERTELRFSPHNSTQFQPDAEVTLDVEIKRVDQLIVRVYELNAISFYRNSQEHLGTDVDLDGLVANSEQTLNFSVPADRRHTETLQLPTLMGRGVWIVDLLGAGTRCRALIQKGSLTPLERLGDSGQVFRIVDEAGKPRPAAHLELLGQTYLPNQQGEITLPYAEQTVRRKVLLVEEQLAVPVTITHRSESYELQARFLLDRQSLVAGTQTAIAIRTRLSCNGRPISIRLLEDAQLSVVATDSDGIATSRTVPVTDLEDGDELIYPFLVPQRLANLKLTLTGKILNQSKHDREPVAASHAVSCNAIAGSHQLADFFLVPTGEGFQLRVLGRNGEPIPRFPIALALKLRQFKELQNVQLATDENGSVHLGELDDVTRLQVSATGLQATMLTPHLFHRNWPSQISIGKGGSVELPLGKQASPKSVFSLYETRSGKRFAEKPDHLQLREGALVAEGLAPGDYILHDFETGQTVNVRVGNAEEEHGFVVGPHRVLQADRRQSIVIRSATLTEDGLLVKVSGADPMTRLHVLVDAFLPDEEGGAQLQLPSPLNSVVNRVQPRNYFVDSLRLDEEYGYILNRKLQKAFPGNMLPQPSLLIHPWEISVTKNTAQTAAGGDAIPASPAPVASEAQLRSRAAGEAGLATQDWKSFDFLASGTEQVLNVGLVDGEVLVPLTRLAGRSHLTLVAVHPTAVDSRHLTLPESKLQTRDQRLEKAFGADQHLVQTQRVEVLSAGEEKSFGDPRTRRLQTFSSLAEVFQLYATLLEDSEWEKFRFLVDWHELSEERQLAHYSELACHELNFFLYHQDRLFFDRVIRPFIEQKLDKQLIDHWLLDQPLEEYAELWRVQRLNALERILLARRLSAMQAGTQRWINDTLAAQTPDPQLRQRLFEIALRGTSLDSRSSGSRMEGFAMDGMAHEAETLFGSIAGSSPTQAKRFSAPSSARGLRQRAMDSKSQANTSEAEADQDSLGDELQRNFYGIDRLDRADGQLGLYRSLPQTRQWAETQYYQVRLADQQAGLIGPNPFWQEYAAQNADRFLPNHMEWAASNLHEALCALAVIDLPFKSDAAVVSIVDQQLTVSASQACLVYLESMDPNAPASIEGEHAGGESSQAGVMVGQELYLALPGDSGRDPKPLGAQALVKGVPYTARVVVTNPTSQAQRVQVLTQLPAGSLPLNGSRVSQSTPIELGAYSTSQVNYTFYFPKAGDFSHYGAQISLDGEHLTATDSREIEVLDAPSSVDETSWSFIADWGTEAQVLSYLESANLAQIDLSRIAFRLRDRAFFEAVLQLLTASGRFDATLWGYAFEHRDAANIEQYLQNRSDFVTPLGPVLSSPLLHLQPQQQMSYEHLDYTPLVVARIHQLGTRKVILNSSLYTQYHALLNVLAHQSKVSDSQALQATYYLLLQNRIEEALHWFSQIDSGVLETQLQFAYLDAYLDFYRADYDRAQRIAEQYLDYPVRRWRDMFAQISNQVAARTNLMQGRVESTAGSGPAPASGPDAGSAADRSSTEAVAATSEQMLTGEQLEMQTDAAVAAPSLEIESRDSQLSVHYRNLASVRVNYYLMDIELLFSRNPFVARGGERVPFIQPNFSQTLELDAAVGTHRLELPKDLLNRNLLVEVTAAGMSRSTVLTASSLRAQVVETQGQIHIARQGAATPVTGAYVKVYAKRTDGSVHFYKDGYTDLRGYFDYASISTPELEQTERFAILVLDPQLGAIVREAQPPAR